MATTVAPALKALGPVLPDLLSEEKVSLTHADGVHHRDARSSYYSCRNLPSGGSVTLESLAKLKLCDNCLRYHTLSSLTPSGPFLSSTSTLLKEMRRSSPPSGDYKSALIERQMNRLRSAKEAFERDRQKVRLSPGDTARAQELSDTASGMLEALKRFLGSDSGAEKILGEVRLALTGDSSFELDDAPTLVPLVNPQPDGWPKLASLLLESFKVSSKPPVLLVPRYAADYLLRSVLGHQGHLPVNAAGLAESELETALKLYDPASSGPYRSLSATVRAARLI